MRIFNLYREGLNTKISRLSFDTWRKAGRWWRVLDDKIQALRVKMAWHYCETAWMGWRGWRHRVTLSQETLWIAITGSHHREVRLMTAPYQQWKSQTRRENARAAAEASGAHAFRHRSLSLPTHHWHGLVKETIQEAKLTATGYALMLEYKGRLELARWKQAAREKGAATDAARQALSQWQRSSVRGSMVHWVTVFGADVELDSLTERGTIRCSYRRGWQHLRLHRASNLAMRHLSQHQLLVKVRSFLSLQQMHRTWLKWEALANEARKVESARKHPMRGILLQWHRQMREETRRAALLRFGRGLWTRFQRRRHLLHWRLEAYHHAQGLLEILEAALIAREKACHQALVAWFRWSDMKVSERRELRMLAKYSEMRGMRRAILDWMSFRKVCRALLDPAEDHWAFATANHCFKKWRRLAVARFMRFEELQVAEASRAGVLFSGGFRHWRDINRGQEIGEAAQMLSIDHGNAYLQRRTLACWQEIATALRQKVIFATAYETEERWSQQKRIERVRGSLLNWRTFAALKAGRQGRFKDKYWREAQLAHASYDYWQSRMGSESPRG